MKFQRLILSLAALGAAWALGLGAARADVLIFADGDRVQGTFVRRENGKIIFQSPRFGDLSVPENEAKVEVTSRPAPPIVGSLPAEALPETEETPMTRLTRLRRLEQGFVRWWEPWNGRLAASTEIVSDSIDRNIFVAEGRVRRGWARDEVKLEMRYEYREDGTRTSVDLLRGIGSWRHDIGKRYFTQYRATVERDKVNARKLQAFPYTLLQQQLGVGVHLLRKPRVKLRGGVAENFFNVWAINSDERSSQEVPSVFFEAELALPWRISVTERALWYHASQSEDQGWENEFEFSKKLTDALSLGVRHEFRDNNPDVRIQDYERLRFLIGYDF
jgi:hypothetical protein